MKWCIPVYKVQPENGRGGLKTLHRNLLLPVQQLPIDAETQTPVSHSSKPKGKEVSLEAKPPPETEVAESDISSDWGDVFKVVHNQGNQEIKMSDHDISEVASDAMV